MKRILIATTNKDKYKIVTYLLSKAGLSEDDYQYQSLDDINYNGPDKKERGSIEDRAETKAKTVSNYLQNNDYEYIIGIDDGIFIKGKLQENIKHYIKKILYEKYLLEGEEYSFYRAYSILTKDRKIFKTTTNIPYTYKPKDNAVLKEHSYPLSQVSVPIGYNESVTDLNKVEKNEYTWKYSREKLETLVNEIKAAKNIVTIE